MAPEKESRRDGRGGRNQGVIGGEGRMRARNGGGCGCVLVRGGGDMGM